LSAFAGILVGSAIADRSSGTRATIRPLMAGGNYARIDGFASLRVVAKRAIVVALRAQIGDRIIGLPSLHAKGSPRAAALAGYAPCQPGFCLASEACLHISECLNDLAVANVHEVDPAHRVLVPLAEAVAPTDRCPVA
jgi:hypothetical protein